MTLFHTTLSAVTEQSFDRALDQARQSNRSGDYDRAAESYREALALSPDSPGVYAELARSLDRAGRIDQAIEASSIATKSDVVQPGWLIHRGQLLSRSGRKQEALEAYETALTIETQNAAWYAQYAQLCEALNRREAALASYKKAVALEPENSLWNAEIKELTRLVSSATVQGLGQSSRLRSATWYNDVYAESPEYAQHYSDSFYYPIWKRIVGKLSKAGSQSLLEIGCGSGQFAQAMCDALPAIQYRGFDFSSEAVRLASERLPGCRVEIGDALNIDSYLPDDYDVVVSMEVLEHIEDDLKVFDHIPADRLFIGTVPDFDSISHVRYFSNAEEVASRYQPALSELSVEALKVGRGTFFLITGWT